MLRVCLKCEKKLPHTDEPFESCDACGVNEWAVVHEPVLKLTKKDREFLRVNRIGQE